MVTVDFADLSKILSVLSQLDLTFTDKQNMIKHNVLNKTENSVPSPNDHVNFQPKVRELIVGGVNLTTLRIVRQVQIGESAHVYICPIFRFPHHLLRIFRDAFVK